MDTRFCGWCGEEGDPATDPGHKLCAEALHVGEPATVTEHEAKVITLQLGS